MMTDRQYEVIQIHRDTFGCDESLLRVFPDASDRPVGEGDAAGVGNGVFVVAGGDAASMLQVT